MGQMTAAGIAAMFAGEPWHYVGEAGEPAFENGWENVPGDTNLAFRIREPGVVDLHGVVQSGTPGAAIFTLPEGYRPTADTAVTALWALSDLSPVSPRVRAGSHPRRGVAPVAIQAAPGAGSLLARAGRANHP